jgi:hypothetical protein
VAIEAAWRARRDAPRGRLAERAEQLVLLAIVVTAAGGLGLFVGGARPTETLHFLYAVVGLGALPVADSLSRRWRPRAQGAATVVAALAVLVVILRLFQTG